MPRATPIQTNFTSGEVSRALRGRIDVNRYANGVEELLNFIVLPQGGAWRRSGTRYVGATKTGTKKSVLREFIYSNLQAYVLEIGDLYMRVYKDGVVVESAPSTPLEVVTPWGEDELNDLYFAQSADVLYVSHPDHPTVRISRTSDTSWTATNAAFVDGPYLAENYVGSTFVDKDLQITTVVDTATAKSSASLFVVGDVGKYIEYKDDSGYWKLAKVTAYVSATEVTVDIIDELILPDPVAKITISSGKVVSSHANTFTTRSEGKYIRTYAGAWYQLKVDGYDTDTSFTYVTTGMPLTMVTYTYPTTTIAISNRTIEANLIQPENASIFTANDVGRQFRLVYNNNVVRGTITGYNFAYHVDVELTEIPPYDIGDTPPTLWNNGRTRYWRLGAWCVENGYPAVVTFHEQRLCFARTALQPQTVWMSVTDDYENFAPTELDVEVLDTNAITYTIVANEVNPILWMLSGSVLLIGTSSSEWQVKASSINEPLTPTNISVLLQTSHGSIEQVRPQRAGNAILFAQRSGRKVRDLIYSFEIDQFQARDVTIISEHILQRGGWVVDMAFQREPYPILWCVLYDGTLAAMTYERDQEVIAWHEHQIGGGGLVESVCAVPSVSGREDTIYMIVKRTINDVEVRYIEYFEVDYGTYVLTTIEAKEITTGDFLSITTDDGFIITTEGTASDIVKKTFYVDCGISYEGGMISTLTGLSYLEGETLQVYADGAYLGDYTVSGGQIVLSGSFVIVHAGYGYQSRLRTLPVEAGAQDGTAQGRAKRIHEVTVAVLRTNNLFHSSDGITYIEETIDTEDFTGNIRCLLDKGYDTEGQYYIMQNKPFPLNILALIPQLQTND